MDALAYELKTLALGTGEGSFATRVQRHRGLQLIARELKALGYKLSGARSLKPKHIEGLVARWQAAELDGRTIKNRMAWVRWWAAKAHKASVVPRGNADLGIAHEHRPFKNRAHATPPEKLQQLPHEWMRAALKLQMAFGLRLEESLKFRPDVADKGEHVTMQASWCKGGRARTMPIFHDRQRAVLDEVRDLVGQGSLIPEGMTYKAARDELEGRTRAIGIRNMHGHRHWHAQWRYRFLTGWHCPAKGGKTYENMTRGERAADYRARMIISGELGHGRISITDVYLGRRFARGAE